MTVTEIINRYDLERPNQIPTDLKIMWLKKLETLIVVECVLTHRGDPRFEGEAPETHIDTFGLDTELIADVPYEDVYIYWMDMRDAINNNDTKRQNVATNLYNNAMVTFQQWYNRTFADVKRRGHLINHTRL